MSGCQKTQASPITVENQQTRPYQVAPSSTQLTIIPISTFVLKETVSANYLRSQTPIPSQQIPATLSPTSNIQKIVPSELREYIGIVYPPLPIGLRDGGSGGIMNSTDGAVDHVLDLFYKDDMHMLWFSKFVKRDSQGSYWKVLDIIVLPELENDEVFIPSGCMINGKYDDELIAIGILDEESYISRYLPKDHIKYVWKANRAAEVFQQLPTDNVECYADQAFTWHK